MSFQAMTWAVAQKPRNAGQKLVLLMLANYCNHHTGQCNPSHKRLAEECCMGVSTLKNHIQELADSGLITVIHKALDGVALPNQYRLNLGGVGQNLAEGGSESDGRVGQNLATNQEIEPGIEPVSPFGSSRQADCPYQAIISLYASKLPDLPQVRVMDDKRRRAIRSFWGWIFTAPRSDGKVRAETAAEALAWVEKYFERAASNDFVMGRSGRSGGHQGWRADIEYLCSEKGRKQVIERTVDA